MPIYGNVVGGQDNVRQAENADTLDGKHASEFASAEDVTVLQGYVGDTSVSEQIANAIDGIDLSSASGVGENVEGKTFTVESVVDGETTTSQVIGGVGAEIFNDYENNVASGEYSHAEGYGTTVSGYGSHAEGYGTTASGDWSHAEGNQTTAIGDRSHTEGSNTTAFGYGSHAEGRSANVMASVISNLDAASNIDILTVWNTNKFSLAKGEASHVEGVNCLALGAASHAEGYESIARGNYSHVEGGGSATGEYAHAEGNYTSARGGCSHAEGYFADASGEYSHAEGNDTIAYGIGSHARGKYTTALGDFSSACGASTEKATDIISDLSSSTDAEDIFFEWGAGNFSLAKGRCSVVEGTNCLALGACSRAVGEAALAHDNYSSAEGYYVHAFGNQYVRGHYNKSSGLTAGDSEGTTGTAFVIGNGTEDSMSNAFRVNYNGTLYAVSKTVSTGADYAEFFEWQDANPNNEDRRGYFVTLDGEKIKIAKPNDYILGIISGQPAIIGNGDEDWRGRYVLDEFGAFITEKFEYEAVVGHEEKIDEETGKITLVEIKETRTGTRYKENPNYDPSLPYIQREDRPEWDAVGMMGVLSVRDDGTCQVNGYCNVANDGIATASESGYRVIKRVTDNIVKIVFK